MFNNLELFDITPHKENILKTYLSKYNTGKISDSWLTVSVPMYVLFYLYFFTAVNLFL